MLADGAGFVMLAVVVDQAEGGFGREAGIIERLRFRVK